MGMTWWSDFFKGMGIVFVALSLIPPTPFFIMLTVGGVCLGLSSLLRFGGLFR